MSAAGREWPRIMSTFTEKKDRIIAKGLRVFANVLINSFGRINDFGVNSKDRIITMNVLLKGENEELQIIINNYRIIRDHKDTFMKFDSIWTSREWLNVFLANKGELFLNENKIKIPEYVAIPINIIL